MGPPIPLGAELNLALQSGALALLSLGLVYGHRSHREFARGGPVPSENVHKNIMTAAILLSGIGLVVWMIPSLLSGWYYTPGGLGYGTGGSGSYFSYGGTPLPDANLLMAHIVVGSIVAVAAVYLLLRMRWAGFPKRLAIQNFRWLMIGTWCLWVANTVLGYLVFYYFAYKQTG
ncbi:MAG: hypothetical protein L3K03_03870 [Thermoplasmata archaeon]|nr:hypothetical protein [Thermoplasmata archaeon]